MPFAISQVILKESISSVKDVKFFSLDYAAKFNKVKTSKVQMNSCNESFDQTRKLEKVLNGLTRYSETISQADKVRQQYLSLPYPLVSLDELNVEYEYYQSPQRNVPYATYHSGALEYTNHFLYRGSNNFR